MSAVKEKVRILIVEDSEVQALELRHLLESDGYDVMRAASAEAALATLNADIPDLIVADLNLPGMDGIELTRQVRMNSRTRAVPVLMLTGDEGRDGERVGLESGADAYIAKSGDAQALLLRVRALLRRPVAHHSRGAAFRQARITVLDSSATFQVHVKEMLAKEGFEVIVSGSADQVRGAARAGTIGDCVIVNLLDIKFDGVQLCRQLAEIRAKLESSSLAPFLIVGIGGNSSAGVDVVRAAFEAGAEDVVASASDIDLLRLRLRALIRRKMAQEEARQLDAERIAAHSASEHFRILVQGVVDYALYMLDPNGCITTWNAGAERIKGYTADEIIGRHFSVFYTPEDQASGLAVRALEQARRLGRYEVEGLRVRKDGTRFWAHVVTDPILDAEGKLIGYAKITRDITERKLAAEELQEARAALMQAQKMEAIGQLTGGIAHDFNNMLAGIIGGLNLLERRITAGRYEDTPKLIEAALTSANRAASLTSRLLAFGRRQSLDIAPVDVNASISSMSMLLERTMGENVTVVLRCAERDVWAMTDVAQLESAVLNLAINARDAMPKGGALTIETSVVALETDESEPDSSGGAFAAVRVSDTGEGMTEEVLNKVFDPFFTTKPIGQGTGLGLSMVYGFVRQSGGRIKIESAPGAGTTVTLALPIARPAVAREDARKQQPVAGSGECVLIVEDDQQVRMLVAEVLHELGYRSIEAGDASQALALINGGEKIDLMISDVGLPGLDGRRLAELARKKLPNVKVLFITGYAQHAAVRSAFLGAGMDMLTKPFALDDLAEKIRNMLAHA